MTNDDMEHEFREFLSDLLSKSQQGKIDAIVEYVSDLDHINSVTVNGTRGGISHVREHGLDMTLDALGDAASVYFPNGAEVIG